MKKFLLLSLFLLFVFSYKGSVGQTTVNSITPNSGVAGTTITALITGSNTFLMSGSPSGASGVYVLPSNSSCRWIYGTNFNIVSDTSLYADFTLPANAVNGPYNVYMNLNSGIGVNPLIGGFTVSGGVNYSLSSVSPSTVDEGTTVNLTITGQNIQSIYQASGSSFYLSKSSTNISPTNVVVVDPNTITADFNFRAFIDTGFYSLTLSSYSVACLTLNNAVRVQSLLPRQLNAVSPNQFVAGTTIPALITGQSTFFQNATPSGIQSIRIYNQNCKSYTATGVNVIDDNNVSANFNIPSAAPNGPYNLAVVTNHGNTFTLVNGVTITNGLDFSLQSCSPSIVNAGSTYTLTIVGQNLQHMTTSGGFYARISYSSSFVNGANLVVVSSDTIQMDFTLPAYAENGYWTLLLSSNDGCYSSDSLLEVQNGITRQLISMVPNSGLRAQTLSAVLTGQYTLFSPGTSTLTVRMIHIGSSYIYQIPANAITVTDSNHVSLNFTIPAFAPAGYYDIQAGPGVGNRYFTLHPGFEVRGNLIGGQVFLDVDSNGTFNGSDLYWPNQRLLLLPDSIVALTDQNGQFYLPADNSSYSVRLLPESDWSQTTSPLTYNFALSNRDSLGLLFGTKPNNPEYDVDVNAVSSIPRCFRAVNYYLTLTNRSLVPVNAKLRWILDPLMTYSTASQPASSINGDTIEWNINNLGIGSTYGVTATAVLPGTAGTALHSRVEGIIYDQLGSTLDSTGYLINQIVTCAYDPNDKLVEPIGVDEAHYVLNTSPLDYTIRFQNTGNDTAFTVVIFDTLSTNLDINTVEVISSSHPVQLLIRRGRLLEFRFDDILLPDSNVDEPGSNGFVKFRVQPIGGIADPAVVENKAYIYFDFNAPVITNTVNTTYVTNIPVLLEELRGKTPVLLIVPNPTNGQTALLYPELGERNTVITITDIQGKICYSGESNEEFVQLDCSSWKPGVYFAEVRGKVSGKTLRSKLIIQ